MPLPTEALRRYDRLLTGFRQRTATALALAWDALDTYDDDGLEQFTALTAPTLTASKRAAIAASTAIFSLAFEIRPPALTVNDVAVTPRINHPFLALWHAVNEGRPNDEALAVGRSQAQAVGQDFVQQTARRTGDAVAQTAGIDTRWRRVPNAGACPWCQTISGQLYRTAESADFGHDRCFCMVVPA